MSEPYVGGHPEMPLHPFEDAGDGTCAACTRALVPERVAHSFAIKYGLREHLTYQQAMGLERDLTTHLRAWLEDRSNEPD